MTSDTLNARGGHTPGPWVEFCDQDETLAILAAGRDDDVCNFCKPYPSREDARLMTAAPDLLAALSLAEPLIEMLHSITNDKRARSIVWRRLSSVRAALAKAVSHD